MPGAAVKGAKAMQIKYHGKYQSVNLISRLHFLFLLMPAYGPWKPSWSLAHARTGRKPARQGGAHG